MSKFRDKVREQEGWIDRSLHWLADNPHTAEIAFVVVAFVIGFSVLLWLVG